MKRINQYEIKLVAGGYGSCLCRCRQHHTENYTQPHWYMFNGQKYEDIIIGHARGISECLEVCPAMMSGNLFKTCLTLVNKEKGWGQSGILAERKIEL